MDDRVKTDIRLTQGIMDDVDCIVKRLGISKNAFYSVSIAMGVSVGKAFIERDPKPIFMLFYDAFKKLTNISL